jgi:hypothetical protein
MKRRREKHIEEETMEERKYSQRYKGEERNNELRE